VRAYDGNDQRVEKISSGTPYKIYWYDSSGNVLDETDQTGSTSNSSFNEYVFFNGSRAARRDYSSNVFFYFADHLGTSRDIVQSGSTSPCYDADYYPFGAERSPYTNTCTSNNYKFTAKERDSESNLDNSSARFYTYSYGRFMSPDPSGLSLSDPTDPQQLNLYAYVRNNPLRFIDPTGLATQCAQTIVFMPTISGVDPTTGYFQFLNSPVMAEDICTEIPDQMDTSGTPQCVVWGSCLTQNSPVGNLQSPENANRNQNATQTCSVSARLLQGNANTIGKPGGFSTCGRPVPVTRNGAAVIPKQWGGARALRPYLNQINGDFPDVDVSFQGIVDTVGSTDVPDVQNFLMNRYPGDLIIELPGASKDNGVSQGAVTVPSGMSCPVGTIKGQ